MVGGGVGFCCCGGGVFGVGGGEDDEDGGGGEGEGGVRFCCCVGRDGCGSGDLDLSVGELSRCFFPCRRRRSRSRRR